MHQLKLKQLPKNIKTKELVYSSKLNGFLLYINLITFNVKYTFMYCSFKNTEPTYKETHRYTHTHTHISTYTHISIVSILCHRLHPYADQSTSESC